MTPQNENHNELNLDSKLKQMDLDKHERLVKLVNRYARSGCPKEYRSQRSRQQSELPNFISNIIIITNTDALKTMNEQ